MAAVHLGGLDGRILSDLLQHSAVRLQCCSERFQIAEKLSSSLCRHDIFVLGTTKQTMMEENREFILFVFEFFGTRQNLNRDTTVPEPTLSDEEIQFVLLFLFFFKLQAEHRQQTAAVLCVEPGACTALCALLPALQLRRIRQPEAVGPPNRQCLEAVRPLAHIACWYRFDRSVATGHECLLCARACIHHVSTEIIVALLTYSLDQHQMPSANLGIVAFACTLTEGVDQLAETPLFHLCRHIVPAPHVSNDRENESVPYR
jgi:hypothetical protein